MPLELQPYEGKRGTVLYAVGTVAGRRINRATGFGPLQKDQARMRALEIELEILRGQPATPKAKAVSEEFSNCTRMSEGFEHYVHRPEGLGATSYATVAKFVEYMQSTDPDRPVASLTPGEVYTYVTINSRRAPTASRRPASALPAKKSASTIRRELNAIQAFVNFVRDIDALDPIKVRKPPEAPSRRRFMTRDERDRLIAACTNNLEWFRPCVVAFFYAGLRRSELAHLRWRDLIETPRGMAMQVVSKKGRAGQSRTRIIFLHPRLQTELDALPRKHDLVFLNGRGEPLLPVQRINTAWDSMANRAHVIDCHPHDARRTLATHMMEAGIAQHRISDLLGHVDGEMLSVYAQMTDEGRLSAILSL